MSLTEILKIQGIGNGLPLGAVVTTPEIASVLAQKIQFNTFGGNPVCSAGGLAVLKVLDKEKRQVHCNEVGSHMIERLRDLQQKHDSNFPNLHKFSLVTFCFLFHITVYIMLLLENNCGF